LIILSFVACLLAPLAADRPWTVDALMNLRAVSDPQITADASKVAYVVRAVNWQRNAYDSGIWLVSTAGGSPQPLAPRHVTDNRPRWSPDGSRLAFLSSRHGLAQVYAAAPDGRDPVQITRAATGVTSFHWSPDGQQIAYLAADAPSPEELERIRRGDDAIVADQTLRYSRIYLSPLRGGQARLLTKADHHVISFAWAPDGARIAYAGQKTPLNRDSYNVDIYQVDIGSGRSTVAIRQEGRDADPSYSPGGRLIAFHSQGATLNYFAERHVAVVPAAGGAVTYLTKGLDGDVFRGGNLFWWAEDGKRLLFGAGKGTQDHLYEADLTSGTSKVLVPSLAGSSGFSVSGNGGHIAYLRSSNEAPPDVYLLDTATQKQTRLSDINPEIAQYPVIHTQTVRWSSKDGLPIEGVLRLPVGYREGRRVPLLVELHGGPTGVALEGFPLPRTYPAQAFAQAGFAVLAPNFRGSSNYGGPFRLANIRSQGFGDFDDVMTGVDALIAQGIADPQRLGVMGWSYGGFLTTWIIGNTNRFKAASIGATASDWISWYGASDGPREVMWTYFGGNPWETWQSYNRHSPRYHLANARTPSLLLHGERDIDTCAEVFQALTDRKVPVEFVTYPREGHGIAEPMHQKDLMARNLRWFERWLLKK